jgi:hypothetical protein
VSTCDRIFTHEVTVDGERMRQFQSLREAQWFCEGKTGTKIIKLDVPKKKSAYQKAYDAVGECLF